MVANKQFEHFVLFIFWMLSGLDAIFIFWMLSGLDAIFIFWMLSGLDAMERCIDRYLVSAKTGRILV